VIVEKKPDEEYKDWLDRAQKALDGRKRLRDFLPQIEDEAAEKGTISGERQALHGTGTSRAEVRAFWIDLTKGLSTKGISVKDIGQEGSERLDAIDTIKRFATKSSAIPEQPFPSTSSIATASFVKQLLTAEIPSPTLDTWDQLTSVELVTTFPKAIPYLKEHAGQREWMLYRDGDCYFQETFAHRYLRENYRITFDIKDREKSPELIVKDKAFISDSITALKALINAVGARPTPYYAIIQMDGDNMGTLLSEVQDENEHIEISKRLSLFSREVAPKLVEEDRPARLVYAGGDDMLAFSPLEGLLDLVNGLQTNYCSRVQDSMQGVDRKKKVTTNIGDVIPHHLTRL